MSNELWVTKCLEPEYHDDRIKRKETVLMFRKYGRDIVDKLADVGFSSRIVAVGLLANSISSQLVNCSNEEMIEISIITATYNAENHIRDLAEDIKKQTDQQFSWILIDGGSTDSTMSFLRSVIRPQDILVSEADCGIYDALNKGVRISSANYYLVAGADDRIFPDTIKKFKDAIKESNADVISASIKYGDTILKPNIGLCSRKGQNALISNHSVSTIFKKNLHDRYGLYSYRLPICADQLFVRTIYHNGAKFHYLPNYVAGYFSDGGVTHRDYFGTLTEFTRVQLKFEKNKLMQMILFAVRCMKNIRKII